MLGRKFVSDKNQDTQRKLLYCIFCELNDQSIASTKTKYIKLKTKTQILFLITFDFCIHFKRENFSTTETKPDDPKFRILVGKP